MGPTPSRCVYTVLTGEYETLNEQPVAREASLPFICFTDMTGPPTATWKIRRLNPHFTDDHISNQRAGKLRPHVLLPEFDQSLYIDNSVLLRQAPEDIFAAADLGAGICLPRHSFQLTLLDEFAAVAEHALDDPARVAEQLAHYMAAFPGLLAQAPFWGAVMLRDHRYQLVQSAMDIWLAHVQRYSRRDQLSCGAAFHLAGLTPGVLEIDNHDSPFHSWPHIAGRRAERRMWRDDAAEALNQLIGEAEIRRRLAQLEIEHNAVLSATTWRMLQPVRAVLNWLRHAFERRTAGAVTVTPPGPAVHGVPEETGALARLGERQRNYRG